MSPEYNTQLPSSSDISDVSVYSYNHSTNQSH